MVYIVYDKKTFKIFGFYNNMDDVNEVISIENNPNIDYCKMDDITHKELFSKEFIRLGADLPIINVENVTRDTIINDISQLNITLIPKQTNEELRIQYINNIVNTIKNNCGKYIENGTDIETEHGILHFTYKIEDQLNISKLLNSNLSKVYYKASGDIIRLYKIDTIKKIYDSLEEHKNFNLYYSQIFCEWIKNNYTTEMYNNGIRYAYGYTNEYIDNRLEEIMNA